MKPLPIKGDLNEDTRLGSVHMNGLVLEMHRDPDDEQIYYITEHAKAENILMMVDVDFWNRIF